MTEKQIKRRLARIRHVAALLAALMMSYHSPTLDTRVATACGFTKPKPPKFIANCNSAALGQRDTRGGNMETVVDCLFDLLHPLLEAEHRWNRNTCDVVHDLDIALLDLEQTHGQGH